MSKAPTGCRMDGKGDKCPNQNVKCAEEAQGKLGLIIS